MSNIAVLRKRQSELHQEAPKVARQLRDTEIALDSTISQLANLTQMLVRRG